MNKKILILGSGGIEIGQAGEFDYSGVQALKALKEEKLEVILLTPNIASVQTSKEFCDKVYFLPLELKFAEKIIEIEKPNTLIISFGGQTALNLGMDLYEIYWWLGIGLTITVFRMEKISAERTEQAVQLLGVEGRNS